MQTVVTVPGALTSEQLQAMLKWLLPLAHEAGQAILAVYEASQSHPNGSASVLVHRKSDHSPLTEADLAAHQIIAAGLAQHAPDILLISEESFKPEQLLAVQQSGSTFWLVDPLDGTKEFLSGTGEFTVNIALIENRKPVLGVVYQPTTEELFWGGADLGAWRAVGGEGAYELNSGCDHQLMTVKPRSEPPWRILASRSHLGPQTRTLIEHMGQTELMQAGSSLKFCRIAAGLADFYPRLGFTSQWDTAAAQAVLEGAGGCVIDLQGQPLSYGQPDIINPHFLASALPYEKVMHWWGDRLT